MNAAPVLLQLCLGTAAFGAEAGWVARINGAPTVSRAGKSEPLRRGDPVQTGDRIDTDGTSKLKLLLADDSVLVIGPRTQVTVDELLLGASGRKGRLSVLFGRFRLSVEAWLTGPSDVEVTTPTAVAGVRGTVLWGDTELDAICALEGNVEVRTRVGDAVAKLEAGRCVSQMRRGEAVPLVPSPEDLARYLSEVTLD